MDVVQQESIVCGKNGNQLGKLQGGYLNFE